MDIDKTQKTLILLATIQAIMKVAIIFFIGWILFEALVHVKEYGLRHLVDAIWLGGL